MPNTATVVSLTHLPVLALGCHSDIRPVTFPEKTLQLHESHLLKNIPELGSKCTRETNYIVCL